MSYSSFSQNYKSPMTLLGESVGNFQKSTTGMFERFRNNKYISGSSEFLNSNTLIAKVSFLLLVIIGFVLILNLSSRILGLMMIPNKNPILINGMHDGEIALHISQNPNISDSVPIYRSVDEDEGLEFTWSSWLFIKNVKKKENNNTVQHIFNKGSDMGNNAILTPVGSSNGLRNGMAKPNNGPGLYLDSTTNKLRVVLNTYSSIIETVTIDNIPMKKWFLVTIRVKDKTLDVYINNNVAARHVFDSVPKQNYGDVYVSQNGGFNGKISNLRYFDYALSGIEVDDLVRNGPNLNSAGTGNITIFPPYLSTRWFFGQTN